MKPRRQTGSLYVNGDTCYLKYRSLETKDGRRIHKTIRLCEKNDKYMWWKKDGKVKFGAPVKELRDKTMTEVMRHLRQEKNEAAISDIRIVDFWKEKYLPYCEEVVRLTGKPRKKPSTVRGYKQIWQQHLKDHFGDLTLRGYTPNLGTRFLRTLISTQGKNTLKHIKALGTAIFSHAVAEELITINQFREVKIPDDAIASKATQHYTLAEAEDIISALVDYVDCQLVMALSCFLGLRPGEIAALRWEDFDSESVHIRRSIVRGNVDTPKTPESVASLPLIDQVRLPLALWRLKCGNPREGWVFESKNGTPVDLHNLVNRIIIPTLSAKRIEWKTLYAGRRGACTAAIETTGGNYAVAQALLRHKSMKTTLDVYKKQITPEAFKTGMKLLEAAGKGKA